MKPVYNHRFDLRGNELSRMVKVGLFGKFVPIGNLRGGPGMRCLAVLFILHYLGYPLYWLNARYGQGLGPVKRLVGRLRNR
ncbi:MAG: hypothetical protein ACWGOX_14885 [Desulforhopalus sp.]